MKDGEVEYKKTEELALKQKCRRGPGFSNSAPTDIERSKIEAFIYLDLLVHD